MSETNTPAPIPVSPTPRKRRITAGTILTTACWLTVVAFLLGSAFFIYRENRTRGLPNLSLDLSRIGPAGTAGGGGGPFAHQNGSCGSCHISSNSGARLYLAINGKDVTDNPSVELKAGEAFELSFHFEGMLKSGGKQTGVGAEVIVPQGHGWSVSAGSGKRADGWDENGTGRTFWSPAWNQAGAGNTGKGGRWRPVSNQPGAFYEDFSASAWAVPGNSAAATDNGSDGDADGRANSMGTDALIAVPIKVEPGKYEVVASGVGEDAGGNPAQVSKRVVVQVDPSSARAAASTKKPVYKAAHGLQAPCGFCHRNGPAVPASHQGLANTDCATCHVTAVSAAVSIPAPAIPHAIEGRTGCLSCHRADGLRPAPADHGGRPEATCTLCHQSTADPSKKPAQIPHPLDDRKDCASCHGSTVVPAVPADHAKRPNEMCTVCHFQADTRPTKAVPEIPHTTAGRADCLTCHAKGMLGSVPLTHSGFTVDDSNCAGCHKPVAQVDVPGRAPNTPHQIDGRSDCTACHAPVGGLVPAPADHSGRPSATCAGCHTPGIDRSGTAPKTPHPVAGREACLTCHSGPMIPLIPDDHKGRTNDSCAACHKERKS